MRLLLDTQSLVWWALGNKRLGKRAAYDIMSPSNQIFVSSLSIFELAVKIRAQKLNLSIDELLEFLSKERAQELQYDFWSAQKLTQIPLQKWKDLFDFGLAAQAAAKQLILMTADENLLSMDWPELQKIDARK